MCLGSHGCGCGWVWKTCPFFCEHALCHCGTFTGTCTHAFVYQLPHTHLHTNTPTHIPIHTHSHTQHTFPHLTSTTNTYIVEGVTGSGSAARARAIPSSSSSSSSAPGMPMTYPCGFSHPQHRHASPHGTPACDWLGGIMIYYVWHDACDACDVHGGMMYVYV